MKKYELTDNNIRREGRTLHRIRALRDIPRFGVKAGDLGGHIETEDNLSHEGDCWIGWGCVASGNSRILDDAYILDYVGVEEDAVVCERSRIEGRVLISGSVKVSGNAYIGEGEIDIHGDFEIGGDSRIFVPQCYDC